MPSGAVDALARASPARAFALALAAGAAHACAGPDHVGAVVALVASARRDAGGLASGREVGWSCARQGARWGVGHCLGLGVITGVFYALGRALDVEKAALASDYVVGCAMCALGAASGRGGWRMLRRSRAESEHVEDACADGPGEAHTHGDGHACGEEPVRVAAGSEAHREAHALGVAHTHVRQHDVEEGAGDVASERESLWKRLRGWRDDTTPAYVVGFVHGVSGLSGVVYVLPAVFLADETRVTLYMLGFFLSSLIAMTAFSALLGTVPHSVKNTIRISLVGGAFVFAVGVMWIVLTALGKLDL